MDALSFMIAVVVGLAAYILAIHGDIGWWTMGAIQGAVLLFAIWLTLGPEPKE